MGYTTDFDGHVTVSPPLDAAEIDYLTKFNQTRRMNRDNGPYFADGTGDFGQGQDPDILDYNTPPSGQPGLWCNWTSNEDGTAIEWDGGEKFYDADDWMKYLIDHFLKPGALAPLDFLQKNHSVDDIIEAQGEDHNDRWRIVVTNNVVTVEQGHVIYG